MRLSRPGQDGVVPDASVAFRGWARPESERLATSATMLTFARTVATLVLALWGAAYGSLPLLLAALATYWVGDMADGALARARDEETRIGAVLDILCDRLSAAVFYVGFAWLQPVMAVPVGIYLAEFLVVDTFLSLSFLAWPIASPNYFFLVDGRIWRWNWSLPGKAVNSALFAAFMVVTRQPWVAAAVAGSLLGLKAVSLGWLLRLGIPVPARDSGPEPLTAAAHPGRPEGRRPQAVDVPSRAKGDHR